MNILHIYDEYGPVLGGGSAPTVVYNLSKTMAKWGHNVTVIERRHESEPSDEYVEGIKFIRIDAKKRVPFPAKALESPFGVMKLLIDGVEFALKVKKFLKKSNNFDVLHVHFPLGNCVLAIDKKLGNKMIYTAHVGEEGVRFKLTSDMPLILKLFSPDLYLMRRVRKSVVLNKPLKDKLVKQGIDEEKIEVIPNGISVKDFGNFDNETKENIKEKYDLHSYDVIVMFAGSITPRKGVDYLVKAGESIIKENKNVLFLLVGSPKYNEKFSKDLAEYIKRKNLDKNIKFTGFVPYEDLKILYSVCDIFVLPSFEEGFGIVLTEAMASGKPLIGTNVGGIPMQVKDCWNGFLVEPGNEKQLAKKIFRLIEDNEERQKMGKNSRKLAEEEFDWSIIAKKYLKIYKSLLT